MSHKYTGYVVWLGGIFAETEILTNPAISPAGVIWQEGLVASLRTEGVPVISIGHMPEPLWPKGRLWVRTGEPASGIRAEGIAYLNIPVLRMKELSRRYCDALERIVKRNGQPSVILSYNAYPYNVSAGLHGQTQLGIPWVCIVADPPNDSRDGYEKAADLAAGRVFLPWSCYSTCNAIPKLFLEGGIRRDAPILTRRMSSSKRYLLYAGRISPANGLKLLLDAFTLVEDPGLELWLCGKAEGDLIETGCRRDPRVKYLGVLPTSDLVRVSESAICFLNPRDSTVAGNRSNFPSKVLHYLAYGRPIISSWTDGLSPEYRQVLIVPPDETPTSWAQTIQGVVTRKASYFADTLGTVREFVRAGKLWDQQAARLLSWLRSDLGVKGLCRIQ